MAAPGLCSVSDCNKPARRRGLCAMHHSRLLRHGTLEWSRPGRAICSIDGCEKYVHSHGLCAAHDKRKRLYGDPMSGSTAWDEPRRFIDAAIASASDHCIFWPFGKTIHGYGVIRHNGRAIGAHRLACEIAHGAPPFPECEAAHSCGKGHLGCINPKHLRWDTRAGNFADTIEHGTRLYGEKNHAHKLTVAEVREIRRIAGHSSHAVLASRFGVSRGAISSAVGRRTWAWLD